MRKVGLKLVSLNLVILLLLSMPFVAFAQTSLQVGNNSITEGETYTFLTFYPGYYAFESVHPITLKNESGQVLNGIENGIYEIEGGKTYTLTAQEGATNVNIRRLYCQFIAPRNQSSWHIVTPGAYRSDLLVFSKDGKLPQIAFKGDGGNVSTVFFYAQKGKSYLAINKEYSYSELDSQRITATSVDCEKLKENVKEEFTYSYDDEGQMATFTPEKTGEYAWECTPSCSALVYDENLKAVATTVQKTTKGQRYTTLLQAGKTYYFAVNGRVDTLSVKNTWTDAKKVFKDITAKDWFVKNGSIDYAYNKGLFAGITPTTFEPNTSVTRGMFVTVLGRLHGAKGSKATTKFTDVKKSAYYSGYVAWASKNGIVSGISDTSFAPEASVTREQICAMLYRYCDYADISLKKINKAVTFADAKLISKYAKTAVTACQRGALVNGKGAGKFDPQGKATRAEVATILMNFSQNYVK